LQSALSLQNADLAKGQISDGVVTADILANDQISLADDYKPLVVGYKHGAAIRLSDVAQVTDSVQNVRTAGYLNGKPAVLAIIFRQPGANIINTVDRIRAQLPLSRHPFRSASIPPSFSIAPPPSAHRSATSRGPCLFPSPRHRRGIYLPAQRPRHAGSGGCGAGLADRNARRDVSVRIQPGQPLADGPDHFNGICGGRCHRGDGKYHAPSGKRHDPFAAALKGAEEIGFTVFTISISLIAVFIPLLLMGGIVGRLFREFAVTLSTAILVSMVISLTTTPMMCAYLLKNERETKHGRLYTASEKCFDWVLSLYRGSLRWVLDHPTPTLVVLFLTIALNGVLIVKIPKGFFPQEDTGALTGSVRGPQDSSFPAMNDSIRQIGAVIKKDPAVANVIAFTGGNGATNTGSLYIALKPLAARKTSAAQIINRLRPQLNRLPVASAFLQAVQDLKIGGRSSNAMYQYTSQSDNMQDLTKWGRYYWAGYRNCPVCRT
jgi:multidrug efflux pump